jgi:hypothetical protein
MIRSDRFLFIHIPRTGGISVTTALSQACHGAIVDTAAGRHAFGFSIKQQIGNAAWRRLFRFTLIRSPWEIVASCYRLAQRDAQCMTDDGWLDVTPDWTQSWVDCVRRFRADPSFEGYVHREVLSGRLGVAIGGFWRAWCCALNGSDLGVVPYYNERLNESWPEIADRCGCPGLELPRLNATEPATVPWTFELVSRVAALCHQDVETFGFSPPSGV